jgi:hypothetical protein
MLAQESDFTRYESCALPDQRAPSGQSKTLTVANHGIAKSAVCAAACRGMMESDSLKAGELVGACARLLADHVAAPAPGATLRSAGHRELILYQSHAWAQGVAGSNPAAPTTFSRSACKLLANRESNGRQCVERSWLDFPETGTGGVMSADGLSAAARCSSNRRIASCCPWIVLPRYVEVWAMFVWPNQSRIV